MLSNRPVRLRLFLCAERRRMIFHVTERVHTSSRSFRRLPLQKDETTRPPLHLLQVVVQDEAKKKQAHTDVMGCVRCAIERPLRFRRWTER